MGDLPTPTGRETDILKVLWAHGSSSVRDVHAAMQDDADEPIAFNTVQTLLRIMEGKQLVTHHVEGRTFIYSPRFSREESASRFLDRVFNGAASELMLSLIRAEKIPPLELDRMHSLIAEARTGRRGRGL
ncbi:MAG TPA: BlaI/MecI/CopY family transcriptional regulator [Gemmataceae bacterium]|jgi:predicted transcriptional regulator|nr:BlaI/MecI/CopY family transcriptional regulator [Gemmataceae bacterium]